MDLYLPEKYRVFLGKGKRVGFCTVWGEPEMVIHKQPKLMSKVAILGSLYSQEGVSILLRNLLLNSDISRVYFWAGSALSKTEFGKRGWSVLKSLWEKGIENSGLVKGTDFYIHREIKVKAVRELIREVELIDISKVKMEGLEKEVKEPSKVSKRQKLSFPECKRMEGKEWPSEVVGWVVRGEKIADVWTQVVDKIMRYGVIKKTEHGSKQRELVAVNWVITGENTNKPFIPDWPKEVQQVLRVTKSSLSEYYSEFMSGKVPEGTAYTYGSRLWNFKRGNDEKEVNQVKQVIDHFKESVVTRRGVMSTWKVGVDGDKKTKNPPCFVSYQFLQVEGKLHGLAVFRSHDLYKAAIPNAFGLRYLQEYVAGELGFEVGDLSITSMSAHIYEEDWDNALKLVRCQIREKKTGLGYDPVKEGIDPRGVIVVKLKQKKIEIELRSSEGRELLVLRGEEASEIAFKLSKLDVLSSGSHWIDIGMELMKAEICLKMNKRYSQDKKLSLLVF